MGFAAGGVMITASNRQQTSPGPRSRRLPLPRMPPVIGDLVATVERTMPAIGTPEITEEAKIRILSADSGSIPGFSSRSR